MELAIRRFSGLAACLVLAGCGPLTQQNPGPGDVSTTALSFSGSASGTANTTSSSTASAPTQSGRKITQRSLGDNAVAFLTDLDGNPLLDANGKAYGDFPVSTNGSFDLTGLPVGVDIVLNIDVDGDGTVDLKTFIHIPQAAGAQAGVLADIAVDPLSTLVLAKFLALLDAQGLKPGALDISPSALIERIRDAFEHLFEDSGIEEDITLADLAGFSRAELAALFDRLIPDVARRGMKMAEANIILAQATDVASVTRAAARIMVEGGFVVLDDPGGVDLSFLGNLANVRTLTFQEFEDMKGGMMGPGAGPGPQRSIPAEVNISAFQAPPNTFLYFSTVAELDRNFAGMDHQERGPGGPWFSDSVIERLATLFLADKTVTMQDLYNVIVDADTGMAARLTYFRHRPNSDDGPVDVFESADGVGIEKILDALFASIEQLGGLSINRDDFDRTEADVRAAIRNFLQGTAAPTFERVFAGILTDRIPSARDFARSLRDRRAHLPFSRSGPSRFFVVATADPFMGAAALPVTVDVELDADGKVTSVAFNPAGTGKFYLSFGRETDMGMEVELLSRRTGRALRDHEGESQRLDMGDATIFASINGQSFISQFSETGSFYPGGPDLEAPNREFDPELEPDPETNPPVFEIWVLEDSPTRDAKPVRVNYAAGVATIDPSGRFFLMFDDTTESNGTFALIEENGDVLETTPGDFTTRVLVSATDIQGGVIAVETFTKVFGVDVPNPGFDATGAPFYDDINDNGQQDAGEPSFDFRAFLFDPTDWRSTNIVRFYRRADTGRFVRPRDVDFSSDTPRTIDGVTLVPRNFKPRLNAFKFGRPNVTINLLMAFSPPSFFNGTQALNADTELNPFMALAIANLVFDSVHNVLAEIDPDGSGPLPPRKELVQAELFVPPVGDPVQLIIDGLEAAASAPK